MYEHIGTNSFVKIELLHHWCTIDGRYRSFICTDPEVRHTCMITIIQHNQKKLLSRSSQVTNRLSHHSLVCSRQQHTPERLLIPPWQGQLGHSICKCFCPFSNLRYLRLCGCDCQQPTPKRLPISPWRLFKRVSAMCVSLAGTHTHRQQSFTAITTC